jgi:hypothetical protein
MKRSLAEQLRRHYYVTGTNDTDELVRAAADYIEQLEEAHAKIVQRYLQALIKGKPATGDLVVELARISKLALKGSSVETEESLKLTMPVQS